MWTPWRLALISGAAAGCATALPQLGLDMVYVSTTAVLTAVLVCFLTRFGLWVSKRPRLPVVPALAVTAATAVTAFLSVVPIETHAEVVDSTAALQDRKIAMLSAHLVRLTVLVLPALIAFVVGRLFGVPPNTSPERTREG